jgi:hypothetical protein
MRTTQNGLAHYAQLTPQRPPCLHASLVESESSFTEEFLILIFVFQGMGKLIFPISFKILISIHCCFEGKLPLP